MNTQKTGEFIKTLRKENNMTQLELAQKLNCTDKAISRWETGKGLPDADMLLSLSDVFSVSINEILLGERFDFFAADKKLMSSTQESQKIDEIISSTDETIVDILKDKENEINKINISVVLLIIACCIQVLIFFVIPDIIMQIKPTAEPVLFLIYASLLNFTFAGLIKDKSKWLFPIFTAVCLLAPLVTENSEGFLNFWFAAIFGAASAVVMAIITGVRFITQKFVR